MTARFTQPSAKLPLGTASAGELGAGPPEGESEDGESALGEGDGGNTADGDGDGVVVLGAGAGAGTGVGDGDGDGDGVGGARAGAGVGVALGETVGAPPGACAMHEVAKRAVSKRSLNIEEPMFRERVFSRERESVYGV